MSYIKRLVKIQLSMDYQFIYWRNNFLLLPFYTRIFSPTEYGNIELLTIITICLTHFSNGNGLAIYVLLQISKTRDLQTK